ncbi:MAG: helix-turn-helix domain-containing protein [Tannerellaceae bacterium]
MEATVTKGNHGANVRRWREWRNINQDVLAEMIGVSQATMSGIEKKETIDTETVEKLAKALDIPVEAITELTKENSVNIFSGSWNDQATLQQNIGGTATVAPTFNPIDRVAELYERLLKSEQEKISLLQEVLRDKTR